MRASGAICSDGQPRGTRQEERWPPSLLSPPGPLVPLQQGP